MSGGAAIGRLGLAAVAALALLLAPAVAQGSVGNYAMTVQPDGKILVAGGAGYSGGLGGGREYAAVVRYLPNGRLDPSFGKGDGVVLLRQQRPFTAIALQENGRILLTSPVGGEGGVTRLLPNGNLDRTFGSSGVLYAGASTSFYPTSIRVDVDGTIFVGGMTGYLNDTGEHWYGWLYRISPNGRAGEVAGGMADGESDNPKTLINDFVFGPNETVIAAGTVAERRLDAKSHAALARLTQQPAGGGLVTEPDPSFGGGAGLVQSDLFPASTFSETANALAWQRGKLLIASEANTDLMVSRYTADGLLDRGFGHRGFESVGFGRGRMNVANDLAVGAKGSIYAAGGSGSRLLLARFGKDGKPARKFGRGGLVSPGVDRKLYGQGAKEIAYAVATRAQGKVLVGGLLTGPQSSRFFLRRYLADGTPDRSFGKAGRLTTLPAAAQRALP